MRLAVLSDLHLVADPVADGRSLRFHNRYELESGPAILTAAVAAAIECGADVIVLLGDLANDGDEELLRLAIEGAGRSGLPVWVVPGNHDAIQSPGVVAAVAAASGGDVAVLADDELAVAGFRVIGVPVTTDDGGETARALAPVGAHHGDAPLLVVSHCPLLSFADELEAAGFQYAGDLTNRAATAESVLAPNAPNAPTIVLSGHLHARLARSHGHVLQLVVSALVEEPHEIAVLDLQAGPEGCRVASRTVRVFDGGGGRAPLLAASPSSWTIGPEGWRRIAGDPDPGPARPSEAE